MKKKDFRTGRLPFAELNEKQTAAGINSERFFRRLAVLFLLLAVLLAAGRHFWNEMRWRYIVIHHTASDIGNLEYYRRLHMKDKGWPDIAYHFVINNGSFNTAMGQIEESRLWSEKSINYSTKVSYINYFGIAVVLVGNFERHGVPPLQWESLVNLAASLSDEYGIPPERIIGHRELWETKCPGRHLSMIRLRREVAAQLEKQKK